MPVFREIRSIIFSLFSSIPRGGGCSKRCLVIADGMNACGGRYALASSKAAKAGLMRPPTRSRHFCECCGSRRVIRESFNTVSSATSALERSSTGSLRFHALAAEQAEKRESYRVCRNRCGIGESPACEHLSPAAVLSPSPEHLDSRARGSRCGNHLLLYAHVHRQPGLERPHLHLEATDLHRSMYPESVVRDTACKVAQGLFPGIGSIQPTLGTTPGWCPHLLPDPRTIMHLCKPPGWHSTPPKFDKSWCCILITRRSR